MMCSEFPGCISSLGTLFFVWVFDGLYYARENHQDNVRLEVFVQNHLITWVLKVIHDWTDNHHIWFLIIISQIITKMFFDAVLFTKYKIISLYSLD